MRAIQNPNGEVLYQPSGTPKSDALLYEYEQISGGGSSYYNHTARTNDGRLLWIAMSASTPYISNNQIYYYSENGASRQGLSVSGAFPGNNGLTYRNLLTYNSGQGKWYLLYANPGDESIFPLSISGSTLTIESGSKFEWGTTFSGSAQYMVLASDDTELYAIDLQNDELRKYTFGGGGWSAALATPPTFTAGITDSKDVAFVKSGNYLYLLRINSGTYNYDYSIQLDQYDISGDSWTTLTFDISEFSRLLSSGYPRDPSIIADYDDDSYFYLVLGDYVLFKYVPSTETVSLVVDRMYDTSGGVMRSEEYNSGCGFLDISEKALFLPYRGGGGSYPGMMQMYNIEQPFEYSGSSGTIQGISAPYPYNNYELMNLRNNYIGVTIDGNEERKIRLEGLDPFGSIQGLGFDFQTSFSIRFLGPSIITANTPINVFYYTN